MAMRVAERKWEVLWANWINVIGETHSLRFVS
jgi:hypothetical protein